MSANQVDANFQVEIAGLSQNVIKGQLLSREKAMDLFQIQETSDIFALMVEANRVREFFKGKEIQLCSIVNAKAGGCSEDCKFCAQSAFHQTASPRYEFLEKEPVLNAAAEAERNDVTALGIVAAWKGLREGPLLDEICERINELAQIRKVRPDASLGMIPNQKIADKLKEAGLECYNHNLETSRRFYPQICSTHSYDERIQTIRFLKQAGIKVCCGGIMGMGETMEDLCELAFTLRELEVDNVPLNFLNPIEGTPFANLKPPTPWEILKVIACFRLILPKQNILIAGGRTVNLRDLQGFVFLAGANALMVGNYLTTTGQPVEKDLQMIADLGLRPAGKLHIIRGHDTQ